VNARRKFSLRTSNTSTCLSRRDEDPLGLFVVYDPPDVERKVDIVFIHGLGGTNRASWSKNKDFNLFWPARFLPSEPAINQARILSFGYDASILKTRARPSASVLDFAKDLLFDMKYGNDNMRSGYRKRMSLDHLLPRMTNNYRFQ
jgi:hypothetical protein